MNKNNEMQMNQELQKIKELQKELIELNYKAGYKIAFLKRVAWIMCLLLGWVPWGRAIEHKSPDIAFVLLSFVWVANLMQVYIAEKMLLKENGKYVYYLPKIRYTSVDIDLYRKCNRDFLLKKGLQILLILFVMQVAASLIIYKITYHLFIATIVYAGLIFLQIYSNMRKEAKALNIQ